MVALLSVDFSLWHFIDMTTVETQPLYRRNPDLIATDMDGETVMMSIERGEYYGIGGVGSRVWSLLEQPASLATVVATIRAEFDVDEATCQADMARFLDELQQLGLVTIHSPGQG